MAFTTAQGVQIRKYLGYPSVYRQANPRLESALIVVGADVDASAEVVSILASISQRETALVSALSYAGISQVDELKFFQGQAPIDIVRVARIYCGRLSTLMGVPLAGDAFGTAGYGDDDWMGWANQYGGTFEVG